uniref:Exocyst complex component Sec8 n=1 Tax=Junco hyemalis TaxID=40217 RepID=A0A8C5NT57_JUNHY
MAAGDAVGRYRSTVGRSKDPSGLLISVIRTLSTSDDVEDRENEKGRLEEAYEKCDRDLDQLIVQHYTELTTAIRTYQSITERITNSRNKIKQVKENLLSCKMLLHCKRDELRKLWIEGIEHKHVLNLLDEIENIKQVPQKLEQCMASKRYLNATDMLVSAVDSLEGPLLQVEGLSDLRLELHSKKMNLHLVLIDELHRHLYIRSTNRVGQRGRARARLGCDTPTPQTASLPWLWLWKARCLLREPGASPEMETLNLLPPNCYNSEVKGLSGVLTNPRGHTGALHDHEGMKGWAEGQEGQMLAALVLLSMWDCLKPSGAAWWCCVPGAPCPAALLSSVPPQMLLTEYLDMKNTRAASEPSAQLSYASSGREFAAFFAKKKPQRPKNPLFNSISLSLSPFLRYLRGMSRSVRQLVPPYFPGGPDDNLIEGGGSKFVCKPGARNITVIFHPLLRFIQEIEQAMELGPAKQCPLREFLTMYIKNIFLSQVLAEINKEIEGVTKASDPLKILANADTMKILGVQRPLLQVGAEGPSGSLKLSLSPALDQLNCSFKIRLGFMNSSPLRQPSLVPSSAKASRGDILSLPPSAVLAAFGKESEVLIGNLGDKLIPQQEILRDVSDLKALANLHESLEWLAARTKAAFSSLSAAQSEDSPSGFDLFPWQVNSRIMETLEKTFKIMRSNHSQPRVHCFHYLIPLAKQGNYAIVANVESMDYDPLVVRLNKDISAIEEAMSASLQQHKFQYIFEGQALPSPSSIKGFPCSSQSSTGFLLGVEQRCSSLCRQYYEMLYNTADELLNLVVDQGVKYTELEYIYALNLLHRSQTGVGDQTTQNMRLQRLKEIICEQAAIKQATKDKKITTV